MPEHKIAFAISTGGSFSFETFRGKYAAEKDNMLCAACNKRSWWHAHALLDARSLSDDTMCVNNIVFENFNEIPFLWFDKSGEQPMVMTYLCPHRSPQQYKYLKFTLTGQNNEPSVHSTPYFCSVTKRRAFVRCIYGCAYARRYVQNANTEAIPMCKFVFVCRSCCRRIDDVCVLSKLWKCIFIITGCSIYTLVLPLASLASGQRSRRFHYYFTPWTSQPNGQTAKQYIGNECWRRCVWLKRSKNERNKKSNNNNK